LKSYLHHGLVPPFYYYRDKDKKEIDLLIVRDNTIYPLECKKTASPGKKDVRHFATLANLAETTGPGGVVCLAADMLPLAEGIYSIPVSAL
jgi:predicted AAA+ superfamily ATPase